MEKKNASIYPSLEKEPDLSSLKEAFEAFSSRTHQLEEAYLSLKREFQRVNLELEATNWQLGEKVSKLDQLTQTLHNILNHMTQGLLFLHLDGTMRVCNPRLEELLSLKKEELRDRQWWDFFSDDLLGFSLKDALKHQLPLEGHPCILERKGREPLKLRVTLSFIASEEIREKGALLLLKDVTEMKRLELIVQRTDRLKELGEMAATMAHEIRNPLGGIKGFADLLIRDLEDHPKQKQLAQYIVQGSETLDRLVSSILHYSRPVSMQLQEVDICQLLQDLVCMARADERFRSGLVIQTHFPSQKVWANVDPSLLRSAILNLLINSAEAMKNQGCIEVILQLRGTEIQIHVKDTGEGIAPENVENIFSPFFTTKIYGNGLGLPEVHRTLRAFGGDISVESTIGEGTQFTLSFPSLLKQTV